MKPITIVGILALLFADTSLADKEPPLTAERLGAESELVVQGRVTAVHKIKDESIDSENEPLNPVKVEHYEAELSVTGFEKRSKKAKDYARNVVMLRFQVVTDKRFKGESIPKLKKGSLYVVYGRTIQIEKDGMATIYLNSSNEIIEVQVDATDPKRGK